MIGQRLFKLAVRLEGLGCKAEAMQIFGILGRLAGDSYSGMIAELYRVVHSYSMEDVSFRDLALEFTKKLLNAKDTKGYKEAVNSLYSAIVRMKDSKEKSKILELAKKIKNY